MRYIDKEPQESVQATNQLSVKSNETSFNIDEMLKDDSEDEERQKNFEMETHISDLVTVNEAHGYRGEMRQKIE